MKTDTFYVKILKFIKCVDEMRPQMETKVKRKKRIDNKFSARQAQQTQYHLYHVTHNIPTCRFRWLATQNRYHTYTLIFL